MSWRSCDKTSLELISKSFKSVSVRVVDAGLLKGKCFVSDVVPSFFRLVTKSLAKIPLSLKSFRKTSLAPKV